MARHGNNDYRLLQDMICLPKVFALLFLCLLSSLVVLAAHEVPENNKSDPPQLVERKSVMVIGAGISGLTAARALANSGLWDVTVVEARKSRYGGRVWTDRVSFDRIKGVEADLGTILFDSRDPQNEMVKNFGSYDVTIRTIKSSYLIDGHSQQVYRGKQLDNITETYHQLLTASMKIAEESPKDISLQVAVNRLYKQNPDMKGKMSTKMFSAITMAKLNLAPCNVSSQVLTTHKDLLFDTIVEEGFQEVADRLLSGSAFNEDPLGLEMNKVVRQIRIIPDPDSGEKKVQVRTSDRLQRLTDAVIVAVPLGVLKNGDIFFEPPLSSDKTKAIQSMGIGTVNNIIFEFRQIFWPKDTEIFHFVPPKIDEIGVMTTWLNTGLLSGRKDPYLTTFIQGNMAGHIENFTDDQLKELALERLHSVFQVTGLSLSDIVSVARSSWGSDSFSKGFFSYPRVGSRTDQWDILSQPICPHIFFAGEHTHSSRYGTVQGAYLSGLRAADQILNGCQQSPPTPEATNVEEKEVAEERKVEKSSNFTKDEL